MSIQFVGDWKKLIPAGFEFQRLYGRNYICYHRDNVWIWKKGSNVELGDLYDGSDLFLKYFIQTGFAEAQSYNTFVINVEENRVEEYDMDKHEFLSTLTAEEIVEFSKTENKHAFSVYLRAFNNRYKQKVVMKETIDVLKMLYENQWIVLSESEE